MRRILFFLGILSISYSLILENLESSNIPTLVGDSKPLFQVSGTGRYGLIYNDNSTYVLDFEDNYRVVTHQQHNAETQPFNKYTFMIPDSDSYLKYVSSQTIKRFSVSTLSEEGSYSLQNNELNDAGGIYVFMNQDQTKIYMLGDFWYTGTEKIYMIDLTQQEPFYISHSISLGGSGTCNGFLGFFDVRFYPENNLFYLLGGGEMCAVDITSWWNPTFTKNHYLTNPSQLVWDDKLRPLIGDKLVKHAYNGNVAIVSTVNSETLFTFDLGIDIYAASYDGKHWCGMTVENQIIVVDSENLCTYQELDLTDNQENLNINQVEMDGNYVMGYNEQKINLFKLSENWNQLQNCTSFSANFTDSTGYTVEWEQAAAQNSSILIFSLINIMVYIAILI